MESYSTTESYQCCPNITSTKFSKLMFAIINENILPEGLKLVKKYSKKNQK